MSRSLLLFVPALAGAMATSVASTAGSAGPLGAVHQDFVAPDTLERIDFERYRSDFLERRTRDGSWWWASNEDYRDQDGQSPADAYGLRFWSEPGGISATGCLWRIRSGEPATVAWQFHQGWDGARGRPFVYQSHASGTGTGFGYIAGVRGDTSILDQDFWWSDGTTSRSRHEERWIDEDTRVGASFGGQDDTWVPNRTYTWERRVGGDVPCGPSVEDRDDDSTSDLEPPRDPRLSGFDPFIGEWDAPELLLEANPALADYVARSWRWGPHGTVVRLGETVHKRDPKLTVFEGLAYWHPVRDRVEFTGYNARLHFFFEGHYEFGPGTLTRIYSVHYPPDFRHTTYPDRTERVRQFRGELRLVGPDELEQRTFMRIDSEWLPWPTPDAHAQSVRARRAGG